MHLIFYSSVSTFGALAFMSYTNLCLLTYVVFSCRYVITRAHSFPRKILPNSAGQLTKFRGSPRQNHPNSAARHGLPFMTENWESCSETAVIEGWYCTARTSHQLGSVYSYVSNIIFFFSKMQLNSWVDWNQWLMTDVVTRSHQWSY